MVKTDFSDLSQNFGTFGEFLRRVVRFVKQKLLEAHIRTHEVEAAKSQEAEASIVPTAADESGEGELIQLICAGCEQGFDDEDQFAGHDCKVTKQTDIVQQECEDFMAWCIRRLEPGETQRAVTSVVGVATSIIKDCGIDSKKQGMFNIGQDKVVHMLPQQIMIDISC
ncbi:zinc finger protein 341 [Trichonephila clavipes]|nr:zinc finger protein 341 [Trichonephila clavipes]